MRRSILWVIPILLFCAATALTRKGNRIEQPSRFPALQFIANDGQWDAPHLFETKLGATKLFAERHALTYKLIDPATVPMHGHASTHQHGQRQDSDEGIVKGHAFRAQFLNANPYTEILGFDKKEVYNNYYIGSNPSHWKSNVSIYDQIFYQELYAGIDMQIYESEGLLKYDFIVAIDADASQIKMEYEGLDNIFLNRGDLHLITSVESIIEQSPVAYQFINGKKKKIKCRFILNNNIVSFKFPNGYNKNYELVIDPVLIFSTFTGSPEDNFGVTAAFDLQDNGYAAGMIFGDGYPTTVGAFQTTFAGTTQREIDVAISKFSANGSTLLFSTYLGGAGVEVPHSLIVNSQNELIIFGTTGSNNFPVTSTSFDNTFNGGSLISALSSGDGAFTLEFQNGSDLFLTKLSANGQNLSASTFIGGSGNDGINNSAELRINYADEFRGEVIVDQNDDIYIASTTNSQDFPVTSGAFNTAHNGGTFDAIVAKFDNSLSSLNWASYFGGSANDVAYSMKLDQNLNVYFTGGTTSTDLPTSDSAIQTTYQGGLSDGFLGRLSNDGSTIEACTYLGTSELDQSYFIEIDPFEQVFVLGYSRNGGYPVTPGRYNNPNSDHFIHKFKPDLDSTFFSTVFGNGSRTGRLSLNAFMIDDCHRIYLSGWGGVVNGSDESIAGSPITADAFQSTTDGSDFYFLVLEPNARNIEYGTFFGGSTVPEHVDGGTSRFDRRGIIYQAVCAGCLGSSDFPTSSSAFSTTNGSTNCNLALIKFDFQLDEINVRAGVNPGLTGCAPFQVQFTNLSFGPIDDYDWQFGDGTSSDEESPVHAFQEGTFEIVLIGSSEFFCVDPDTTRLTVVVSPADATTTEDLMKCAEDGIRLTSKNIIPGATYEWSDFSTNSSLIAFEEGVYWVKSISPSGCFVDSFTVTNFPIPSSVSIIEGCEPEDYILAPPITGGVLTFEWQDGSTGETFLVRDAGVYWVQSLDPVDCDRIDTFLVDEYPLKDPIITSFELCAGKTTTLTATESGSDITHVWHDGSSTESIDISGPGVYWVITSYPFECPLTDSFIVSPAALIAPTLDSSRICEATTITLASQHQDPGSSFLWSNGATTPTIDVGQTGLFTVVTDFDRICPLTNQYFIQVFPVIDENDIYFPNAFSPNNDGINDRFRPFFSNLVTILDYELKVFDRWGKKVFETESSSSGWEGINSNQAEGTGVYVWYSRVNLISCTGEALDVQMKGDISIIK